jgi:hypothetical protein
MGQNNAINISAIDSAPFAHLACQSILPDFLSQLFHSALQVSHRSHATNAS